eukprot:TRINITY_DN15440_c0_g1_i1.p9 TRINITY_DN15440_c0_g1~~TRINITY_DN15440_c0_g1_i1.p9  ORF type:complete len:156 (+),score=43.77 TRINITY_DN15440_c0_g1_i1:408-875(+)
MAQYDQQNRRGMIAKIKIAMKQLGMDDGQYRTMLLDRYGKDSAAKLGLKDMADCVRHMEALGATFTSSRRATVKRPTFYEVPDGVPFARQKRWIAAMWHALGWKMSGLDLRSAKQFGVEQFLWIKEQDHLQTLAKDLMNRCRAKGIDPDNAEPAR